ncbi:hypothetical protein LSTR_LSTR006734 [Laodelphax striatellus]|uniref:Uncharacterized protein n=1 Tax=Laodelphax striatellus TaxID=195883 RepID=A0A482XWG6_LAOST|nr:hypothetical protein LSTR_LSTR006734 [Laodelphax striatellus]
MAEKGWSGAREGNESALQGKEARGNLSPRRGGRISIVTEVPIVWPRMAALKKNGRCMTLSGSRCISLCHPHCKAQTQTRTEKRNTERGVGNGHWSPENFFLRDTRGSMLAAALSRVFLFLSLSPTLSLSSALSHPPGVGTSQSSQVISVFLSRTTTKLETGLFSEPRHLNNTVPHSQNKV